MIKHPSFGTLEEYLNTYLKPRIEKGLAVIGATNTLTWFAGEYQRAKLPAEPGATSHNSNQRLPSITLADIDNVRVVLTTGTVAQAQSMLEELAAKIK